MFNFFKRPYKIIYNDPVNYILANKLAGSGTIGPYSFTAKGSLQGSDLLHISVCINLSDIGSFKSTEKWSFDPYLFTYTSEITTSAICINDVMTAVRKARKGLINNNFEHNMF